MGYSYSGKKFEKVFLKKIGESPLNPPKGDLPTRKSSLFMGNFENHQSSSFRFSEGNPGNQLKTAAFPGVPVVNIIQIAEAMSVPGSYKYNRQLQPNAADGRKVAFFENILCCTLYPGIFINHHGKLGTELQFYPLAGANVKIHQPGEFKDTEFGFGLISTQREVIINISKVI
jgi:hypothetical protein